MSIKSDDEMVKLFERAAAIAEKVPPAMQDAAFNRALDMLGGAVPEAPAASGGKPAPRTAKAKKGHPASQKNSIDTLQNMRRSDAEDVDNEDGALAKSLALLRVAHRKFDIDGLTSSQIASLLTDKFRWRVSRQAVTQALDRAGRLVDRTSGGSGAVIYRIMEAGESYLSQPLEERKLDAPGARRSKSAGSKKTKAPSRRAAAPSTQAKATSKKTSRLGPKQAIEALLAKGFFSKGRTLGSIRTELEVGMGHRFKTTDLSPAMTRLLRAGTLTRSRNGDNQYEYVAS